VLFNQKTKFLNNWMLYLGSFGYQYYRDTIWNVLDFRCKCQSSEFFPKSFSG